VEPTKLWKTGSWSTNTVAVKPGSPHISFSLLSRVRDEGGLWEEPTLVFEFVYGM